MESETRWQVYGLRDCCSCDLAMQNDRGGGRYGFDSVDAYNSSMAAGIYNVYSRAEEAPYAMSVTLADMESYRERERKNAARYTGAPAHPTVHSPNSSFQQRGVSAGRVARSAGRQAPDPVPAGSMTHPTTAFSAGKPHLGRSTRPAARGPANEIKRLTDELIEKTLNGEIARVESRTPRSAGCPFAPSHF